MCLCLGGATTAVPLPSPQLPLSEAPIFQPHQEAIFQSQRVQVCQVRLLRKKIQRKRKIVEAKSEAIKKLRLEQTTNREKMSNIIETEVKRVTDKAIQFMDGVMECCRMVSAALVKKIEECPPAEVVSHLKNSVMGKLYQD